MCVGMKKMETNGKGHDLISKPEEYNGSNCFFLFINFFFTWILIVVDQASETQSRFWAFLDRGSTLQLFAILCNILQLIAKLCSFLTQSFNTLQVRICLLCFKKSTQYSKVDLLNKIFICTTDNDVKEISSKRTLKDVF